MNIRNLHYVTKHRFHIAKNSQKTRTGEIIIPQNISKHTSLQDLIAKLEVEILTELQLKRRKHLRRLLQNHSLSFLHFSHKMKPGLSYIKRDCYIFYAMH